MTDNTAIWDALGKTDPSHTKAFNRAGGFKGTAVKPMWVMRRLTEQFGPCGLGWGVGEPVFQVVNAETEILVYCTVSCWHGETDNTLYGVGGDKVRTARQSGGFNDDEAFKKAFTDAIMNAFKFVGVAADVHMGLFDDSKYVAEMKREFGEEPANGSAAPNGLGTAQRDTGPGSVDGKDWWGCAGPGLPPASAKRDEAMCAAFDKAKDAIQGALTEDEWRTACRDHAGKIAPMPRAWRSLLRADADAVAKDLHIDLSADRRSAA